MQAADLLTKPLDRKRFVALRRYLMNTDAMVEAPVEGRAAGRGTPDPMRQDGYVTPAGEKTVLSRKLWASMTGAGTAPIMGGCQCPST